MHIAVISCNAYRDAWPGFLELLHRFWPEHPEVIFLTEEEKDEDSFHAWCGIVARHAKHVMDHVYTHDPILLMQEDFFLTAPVHQWLIDQALYWMRFWNAGACRLYPMPGADGTWDDDRWGFVRKSTRYRINCQAAIYRPDYLYDIATHCGTTPSDFEIWGTEYADTLPDMVLACYRESKPWPMEYLCSGISRGQWNPDTKPLFEANGIEVDWAKRGFYVAP